MLRPERLAALFPAVSWRPWLLARRATAGLLVLIAAVLALRAPSTSSSTAQVVVATRDLVPGVTVRAEDVRLQSWPVELLPVGVITEIAQIDGRVLAGAASAGEALTAVRLAGPELAVRAGAGSDAASVPIRLADADVAGLLVPGRRVDVVSAGERSGQPTVLAASAVVLTVLPGEARPTGRGRLVLVAVPRPVAAKLAAAALSQEVTVTLR